MAHLRRGEEKRIHFESISIGVASIESRGASFRFLSFGKMAVVES